MQRRLFFSWHCKCNEEGRSQRDGKDYQINKSADAKFKHSHKPALPVNATNREKNLHGKDRPENSHNPSGQNARHGPIQSQGGEHDQHNRQISERVNVESADKMVDVKNVFAQIKNFEDTGEEGDATEYHVREIADNGDKEQLKVRSALAKLLFSATFNPLFESVGRRCRIGIIKLQRRATGLLCFRLFV